MRFLGLVAAVLALSWAGPLRAAPNLFGEPGLILTPSADPTPYGEYSIGVNTVDEVYRRYPGGPEWVIQPRATVVHYCHIGILPGIAATAGFANVHGKLFADYFNTATNPMIIKQNPPRWYGGFPIDRFLSIRAQIARQGRGWPSLAAGLRDSDGNSFFGVSYLVASYRFRSPEPGAPLGLGLHAGYGRPSRRSTRYQTAILDGIFGGVDYWPSTRWGVMIERTAKDVHLGARWSITRQVQLQPSLMGLRWLGGGISFTSRL